MTGERKDNGQAPNGKIPKQHPMVGWYNPRQLAQTAIEVAVSTIFGRHSDHRLVEAMAAGEDGEPEFYDYTLLDSTGGNGDKPKRTSIWIDYVGDVGDGWNSTYAVAYYLAQEKCELVDPETRKPLTTHRGDLLIFGGDEVYPTASRVAYRERLLAPYETAMRNSDPPHPHAFAIPGNHDWYDSLVAFTRLFTSRRWFAGWRTRQTRSYFAIKLPHNWWLLGTDVQLGSDIDGPQVEYFERVSKEIKNETETTGVPASLILCHAEPHWIRSWQYEDTDSSYSETNLRLLEKRLRDVAVFIAGDLHHYRRHEALDRSTQKITAGGGGAFLHPTHSGLLGTRFDRIHEKTDASGVPIDPRDLRPDQIFDLKRSFPSEKESSRACWRNLAFPFFLFTGNQSWSLGFATAFLYLLLAFPVPLRIDDPELLAMSFVPGNVLGLIIQTMTSNAVMAAVLILLTLVGFVFFTDTHKTLYRIIGGGLHGIAHIFSAYYIALIAVYLLGNNLPRAVWRLSIPWPTGFEFFLDLRMILGWAVIFVAGFFVGTFIMGLYLIISLNFFGRHGNEAFSSLGIEDWKNFLRLHIDEQGALTIYPIGLRRVPRKWKPRTGDSGPELEPDPPNDDATKPLLIEPPIVMQKAATGTGVKRAPTPATSS